MHALFETAANIAGVKYLESAHMIKKPKENDETDIEFTFTDTPPPPSVIEMQIQGVKRRRERSLQREPLTKTLTERFKAKLLQWMIVMNVAFIMVECNLFRDFIEILNKPIKNILPKAGDIIRN
jgi:hypothetical protein